MSATAPRLDDPAGLAISLFLLAAGVVAYAAPTWPYRPLGQAGLSLGAALATARYLGPGAAAIVAGIGLAVAWLLGRSLRGAPRDDALGLSMRLLLAGTVAAAAVIVAMARPLGAAPAFDLNLAWYWTGAIGLLVVASERDALGAAVGGALATAALGLAVLHVLGGAPPGLLLAAAAQPFALAAAAQLCRESPVEP